MIRETQLSAAKSRWSKIVYTWTDELIRRWCYELPFHIQVQEASCFFIFLNQITSGFKRLFSSLTGLARNPILAILGTLSCYIRSQISWGSWVQGDEQKLLLSLCVCLASWSLLYPPCCVILLFLVEHWGLVRGRGGWRTGGAQKCLL